MLDRALVLAPRIALCVLSVILAGVSLSIWHDIRAEGMVSVGIVDVVVQAWTGCKQ